MMADPQPPTPRTDRMMLSAMGDLTKSLQRLTEHMDNAEKAAVQRGRDLANAESVAARSQVAVPAPGLSPRSTDQVKNAMDRLAEIKQQRDAQPSRTNVGESVPPGTTPGGGQEEENPNAPSDAEALTFAMLGSHGGPFGRLRMQQYMLQRNIDWGVSTSDALGKWLGGKAEAADAGSFRAGTYDTLSGAAGTINQKLQWAQSPKGRWVALGGLAAYRGGQRAVNAIMNWQEAGRALGYGSQANTGFLGFRNPLSQFDATKEGLSLAIEREALMGRIPGMGFGAGLSKEQAKEAVGTLAAQGFSNDPGIHGLFSHNMVSGDNFQIAQNLLRPLMNMGLTAQDAAQWTPALRNAATTMDQLKDSLSALPAAAKTAKQTVADLNAQLLQIGQTTVQQGGTLQKGAEIGLAFESATGMQPAIANQLMQNPIYQGIMMGRYGVLPSGITDLPGGAQAEGMLSMFNLLKGATAGLNHDKYANVRGVGRELIARGTSLQDSQIAQMMGISRAEVDRLRNQAQHGAAISQTMTALGSSSDQTGMFDPNMDPAKRQAIWQKMVEDRRGALGLTHDQLKKIDSKGSFEDRFKELQKDLLGNHAKDKTNQINVHVKFTGAAAKWFEQQGRASGNGLALRSNSGGEAANNVLNSPYGDALAAGESLSRHWMPYMGG